MDRQVAQRMRDANQLVVRVAELSLSSAGEPGGAVGGRESKCEREP